MLNSGQLALVKIFFTFSQNYKHLLAPLSFNCCSIRFSLISTKYSFDTHLTYSLYILSFVRSYSLISKLLRRFKYMPVQTSFNPNGRKELKHAISKAEYNVLRSKLLHFMQSDPNAGPNGKYLIRSTYFDNFDNKALNEKKEGFLNRDKYRVRIYGLNDHVINLERKSKRNNLTFKSKCTISRKEYEKMRIGDIQWMENDERSLIRDLYFVMSNHLIKPQTVVDYEREAFIYAYGNVRVTFDMKVQSSLQNTDMFNKHLPMVDVLEPNLVILEVKYDEYIPEVIKLLLQLSDTRQEAYSKYQLSRMYG